MQNNKQKEIEEQMSDNVIPILGRTPVIKPASKEPPGNNWLATLKPGTVFICQKPGEIIAAEYVVVTHSKNNKTTLLFQDLNEPAVNMWVVTALFSSFMELVEVGEHERNVNDEFLDK